jgi:lipoate synthase
VRHSDQLEFHFFLYNVLSQVISTMEKVRAAGVDVFTLGQYMRPSKRHMPVSEYVSPQAFERYRSLGVEMVTLICL